MIAEIQRLLGSAPAGFDWLEYLFAGIFLVFLVHSAVSVLSSLLLWIGGKR